MRFRFLLPFSESLLPAGFLLGREDAGSSIFPTSFGPSNLFAFVLRNSVFTGASSLAAFSVFSVFSSGFSAGILGVSSLLISASFFGSSFFFGRLDFIVERSILPTTVGPPSADFAGSFAVSFSFALVT